MYVQVATFCVSFAFSEVFISESLYVKKNINEASNLYSIVQQNQGPYIEVQEKGGWGERGSCEDDQN